MTTDGLYKGRIFKHDFWLVGSTTTSRSEATLESLLTSMSSTWDFLNNPGLLSSRLKVYQRTHGVIESIKTTSMETVSTGVLDRNKEHYLRSKDKAEKSYDVLRHIQCICQNFKKKWRFIIHYVKPTSRLLFKSRFPKSGQIYRRQVVNPRHQTPQGQSVAKPETPLQKIQVE